MNNRIWQFIGAAIGSLVCGFVTAAAIIPVYLFVPWRDAFVQRDFGDCGYQIYTRHVYGRPPHRFSTWAAA